MAEKSSSVPAQVATPDFREIPELKQNAIQKANATQAAILKKNAAILQEMGLAPQALSDEAILAEAQQRGYKRVSKFGQGILPRFPTDSPAFCNAFRDYCKNDGLQNLANLSKFARPIFQNSERSIDLESLAVPSTSPGHYSKTFFQHYANQPEGTHPYNLDLSGVNALIEQEYGLPQEECAKLPVDGLTDAVGILLTFLRNVGSEVNTIMNDKTDYVGYEDIAKEHQLNVINLPNVQVDGSFNKKEIDAAIFKAIEDGVKPLIILQPTFKNPTGFNYTAEQQEAIIRILQPYSQSVFVLVDSAYFKLQDGKNDGDFIRKLDSSGVSFAVYHSNSKLLGTYREIPGANALFLPVGAEMAPKLQAHLSNAVRPHGIGKSVKTSQALAEMYNNPISYSQMQLEQRTIANALSFAREQLRAEFEGILNGELPQTQREILEKVATVFGHQTNGLFRQLPLEPEMIQKLNDAGVITAGPRISLAGALEPREAARLPQEILNVTR